MEVNAINSLGTAIDASDANFALNFQDYLQLLVTEISTQDPLNPVDNKEFITQLATYSQLNLMNSVSLLVGKLSESSNRQEVVSMLGKEVEVINDNGQRIIGEVVSAELSTATPSMTIKNSDGEFISNIQVSSISLVR
jgi:flagellar basal-body rod modification protein FlgD